MGYSKIIHRFLVLVLLCALNTAWANINSEFPGRDLYPKVNVIELDEFHKQFDDVVIVDVRSKYEYDTLRIKGAVNIPLASDGFLGKMRNIRKRTDQPIVVYCNGRTCSKSYKAAHKCKVGKVSNVTAFDSGIMDWAKSYPKLAILLGKELRDPRKLISKKSFKKHLISPDDFGERIATSPDIVLDVRDRFQREGISIFVGREHRVFLDDKKKLDKYIREAKRKNRSLLIYDAAGKQVRWLQYYLQNQGVKKYNFMEGGIRNYYEGIKTDLMTNVKEELKI